MNIAAEPKTTNTLQALQLLGQNPPIIPEEFLNDIREETMAIE